MCYNRWNNGLGGVAKTHRWIESKWNGVANGMPFRCNRYRIPLDRQPPRNERKRCNSGIDGVWSPFGHPLVGIILFRTKGLRSASLSRPLCFPTPLKTRIPATSVYYPFVRKFYSFLLYDFDDVEEICINSKIIWRNGKFKRLGVIVWGWIIEKFERCATFNIPFGEGEERKSWGWKRRGFLWVFEDLLWMSGGIFEISSYLSQTRDIQAFKVVKSREQASSVSLRGIYSGWTIKNTESRRWNIETRHAKTEIFYLIN